MSSSMIRPFFVSLTLFGLLLSVRVWGYEFTHLTKDNNGLSYDGISAIMQDSRGFIWIGTYKGLNRYDGNTFKVYGMLEMGLDSDFVYSIVEDSEGNLWIGTDKGVCMYSYRQDRFVPLRTVSSEGSVITNKVTFITVEPDGRVWMLVNDQGCFAYDIHRGELHEWPYRKIGFSGFRKMLRCVDGDVWISRYHSNLYHADSSFREVHPVVLGDQSDFFEDDEIEGLFYAPDGSLLVASMKRGLSEVDLVAKRVEVLLALPENSLLQHAFLENDRNVWLSTSKGVWRYDLLTGESLCLRNDEMDMFSLSNDYTTCTFVDKDGGLWVGTKDAGVNYSGPSQNNFEKQYLADGESLENVLVSGFAEDEAGRIWVATEEKGLLVYNPQAHRTSKYRLEGIPSRICSICYDDGYLWFGTRVGLFRLDIAANRLKVYGVLKRVQGVNDPNVYMIYKTSDGEIFVGTTLGLFRYERSSDSFLEIPAFDGIFTTSAVEDPLHPGVVWFSSYANGVYCWDSISDKLVNYDASSGCGLTNDKICSIFIDHKARIWAVGFSIGVAMFDRESGRFCTAPQKLDTFGVFFMKYNYEIRLKAVKLVLEGGLSVREAGCHLGCGRSQVHLWVTLFERHGLTGLKLRHGSYSAEFKLSVLKHMHQNHLSLLETAVHFGIPGPFVIRQWERLYQNQGAEGLRRKPQRRRPAMSKSKTKKVKLKTTPHEELLKELEYLRAENAYLKKLQALVEERIVRESGKEPKPSKD